MPFHTQLRVRQQLYFDLLDAVSSRWAILIIEQLNDGPMNVNAICQRFQYVPRRVIESTLNHMQREGVISVLANGRSQGGETVYSLTEVGQSAVAPVYALHTWARTHHEEATALAQGEANAARFFMMQDARNNHSAHDDIDIN